MVSPEVRHPLPLSTCSPAPLIFGTFLSSVGDSLITGLEIILGMIMLGDGVRDKGLFTYDVIHFDLEGGGCTSWGAW